MSINRRHFLVSAAMGTSALTLSTLNPVAKPTDQPSNNQPSNDLSNGLATPKNNTVRVALVAGIALCGVWEKFVKRASKKLTLTIETVGIAPKELVGDLFLQKKADLLLIHANDEAMSLQANGLTGSAQVWGWNEHVFAGPIDDPLDIRHANNGIEAISKITKANAPFIAFRDPGSYAVVQRLWRRAGVRPTEHVLIDTSATAQQILQLASQKQAYVVVGHIPLHFGKMPKPDDIDVLLKGDPMMRKPYLALTHKHSSQYKHNADKLAHFLLSQEGQKMLLLANLDTGVSKDTAWIFPKNSVPPLFNNA